ncbi:MAG: type 1 glutamine amidotransferase [Rhodobacteraceae bacterium]|nr:type 1 glutamine amidotransferase [Paracoccaceae bacterium]
MKIGILQTGHSPEDLFGDFGDYDAMFRDMLDGNGFEFQTWAVVDGILPDGPQDADAWLITGSKHGAYEDHAWIPPLEDLIRAIHTRKQPLAGICFGHQIIAQALGGKVEKFEGGWAVGRVTYKVGGKGLTLNAWHQDQVVDLPEGARVLGGNDFCQNGILAYGDHIISWQPHPEFPNAFVGGLIEKRGRGVVPDDLLNRAAAELDAPVDNQDIATLLADFYRKERI